MPLPPLYKYLDIRGAKLTLQNRTFRHAKPSDFNDTEDLTVGSIFPEDETAAIKKMQEGFTDVLFAHLHEEPTCLNDGLRKKVALLQHILKNNPAAVEALQAAKARGEMQDVFDVEQVKSRNRAFIDELNVFLQRNRVLCVSTLKDSERMWARYAQAQQGIVLRIVPNLTKDSKFQLFRPVQYRKTRPPLYESVRSFQEGSLFGDQEARIRAAIETIIYSKTLDWEYESEYRLAVPLRPGECWNTLSYHPEEIAELYVGAKASPELKAEYVALAKTVNPAIALYEMFEGVDGKLSSRCF